MKLLRKRDKKPSSLPNDFEEKSARYVYLWYDEGLPETGGSVASITDYVFRTNHVPENAGIEIHSVDSNWFKDAFSNGLIKAALDTQEYRKKNNITGFEGFRQKLLAFTQEGEANNKKWYCLAITISITTPQTQTLASIKSNELQDRFNAFANFLKKDKS